MYQWPNGSYSYLAPPGTPGASMEAGAAPPTVPDLFRTLGSKNSSAGASSNDIFGSRVAPIPMPNPSGDLSAVYPNLSGTNAATSSALLSQLHGQLSPDTVNQIHDAAATWGVSSGMPGFTPGSLNYNRGLRDIGLTSEQQQQKGLGNYSPIVNAVSKTQTVSPETQNEVNATNATNAAAPDPAAAASYAQSLFDKYLQQLKGPAAGTGTAGSGVPWYAAGHAGQNYRTPGAAGGGAGDTSVGAYGNTWG